MKKVLITDDVHPLLIDGLQKRHYEVDFFPLIKWEETFAIISNYEGLVVNTKTYINKLLLDEAKQLKWIGRLGSGMEIIDLEYAKAKGVKCINTPEANRNAVAEHALGMLLSLIRNIGRANSEVKDFQWFREKNRGTELGGKTVGIIGFGHNGSRFGEVLAGLNVKVLVFDKYKQLILPEDRFTVTKDVQEIQEEADIVSLHVPLNAETTLMINKAFFDQCKKPIILINTSRGKVVNTEDLLSGLKSGKLKGACLDVFENENPKEYSDEERLLYGELFEMENVVCSPHIAGWTWESKEGIAKILLEKLDMLNI